MPNTLTIAAAAIKDSTGAIHTLPAPARHSDIIMAMIEAGADPTNPDNHGFIASDGSFVDRATAKKIAERAGQLRHPWKATSAHLLNSEEVW